MCELTMCQRLKRHGAESLAPLQTDAIAIRRPDLFGTARIAATKNFAFF